jgi:hopene-associated glycosyltransferase HpnB
LQVEHVVTYSPFIAVTLASLAGWTVLLAARGGFWRARVDAHLDAPPFDARAVRVEAIVPARDEADVIWRSLPTLVGQRFAGEVRVTVVDDASHDETAARARAAAEASPHRERLAVVAARPLESGWSGKLNALDTGVAHVLAERGAPDFWLFTDADIEHDRENLAALVAKACADGLDLVSLMVRLRCESAWEKLLVPAFVFFFAKLYPFTWANDPKRELAAAAGGCVLISHRALQRIGGLSAIGDRLIDDCALAAAVKRTGGRTWLGLTDRTTSVRRYESLSTVWAMVKRSAFAQLRHSYALLAVTLAAMVLLYIVPPVSTLVGVAQRDLRVALAGALAWGAMAFAYRPTLRAYGRHRREAFALPAAAALYTAMTLDSALAHARKRGGRWKNRTY